MTITLDTPTTIADIDWEQLEDSLEDVEENECELTPEAHDAIKVKCSHKGFVRIVSCTDSLVLCKNVYDQMDTSILAHFHCQLCNTHCYHVETL